MVMRATQEATAASSGHPKCAGPSHETFGIRRTDNTHGPRVVVICAYERGLTLASGQRLGRRAVAALGLR
jgi:hypothetical protein